MKLKELEQVYDGQWFQPVKRGWQMGCCDCGLVHRVNFRIKHGKIQMQTYRDKKLTAAYRRITKLNKRS